MSHPGFLSLSLSFRSARPAPWSRVPLPPPGVSLRPPGVSLLSDPHVLLVRLWAARRGRLSLDQAATQGPLDLSSFSYGGPSMASNYGESDIHSNERKSGLKGTAEMLEHLSSP